jgi:hypothetical protein
MLGRLLRGPGGVRKLSGACYHLLLSRSNDLNTLKVTGVASTQEAIDKWDWTTRSSPIFSFEDTELPDFQNGEPLFLFFVGPIDPGFLDIDVPAFATLGTYNLLLVAKEAAGHLYHVRDFLKLHSEVRWECWEVSASLVTRIGYGGGPLTPSPQIRPRRAKVSSGLASAEEENCTLLAAATSKAHQYFPKIAEDLETFASAFHHKLENSVGDGDNTKLSWLVNVNAHLSRFTSQAFSGVSPIQSTESHFWSHSLLGVGMACQALVNIRHFSQRAVGAADWIDSLDRLGQVGLPATWIPLMTRIPRIASVWADVEEQVQQAVNHEQSAVVGRPAHDDKRLPLIVCFSGRDGFRSTPFSLSAPLEVISGANAFGWTPMTLTHEICHVWLSGILGTIFPNIGDSVITDDLGRLIGGERPAVTVLDDLRQAFYYCFLQLEREALRIPDIEEEIPADDQRTWLEVVEGHILHVNETLTHILDYQFFYQQDESRYVKSIWSSWDVIPNIKDRLTSYLIRSACALLSERINHEDPINETLARLESLLKELKEEMGDANYLADAIGILTRDADSIREKIERRELLVRLAKTFFANRPIAARLDREHQETGAPYKSLSPLVFDYKQIWNPLRFVNNFSVDRRGDRAKSLWILAKISFMQDPDETFA